MRFVVFGAGGQARETEYYIREMGHVCVGFVVTDFAHLGPNDSRDRVLGDVKWVDDNITNIDAFAVGIGTPSARIRVATDLKARHPEVEWPAIVHPTATLDRTTAKIGEGVLLGAGATLTVNVVIENFAMINFGASVGHEARIGRGAVINPGANISGGVDVGDGALVGAGAVVLQYRKVGARAVVGAGAVVTRDVPDGVTVIGIPARPLRR